MSMQREPIHWQPLTMLPTLVMMADDALAEAEEQLEHMRIAVQRPGLLDAATIDRAVGIYEEQRHFLTIYAEQGRRWQALHPTGATLRQLDAFLATTAKATTVNAELLAVLAQLQSQPTNPQDEDWYTTVGEIAMALADGRVDEALAWADDALDTSGWTARQRAELLGLRGLAWVDDGDFKEAERDYRAALALWAMLPEDADRIKHVKTWDLLIQALLHQEDFPQATEAVTTLVQLVDTHKDGLFTQPDGPRLWMATAYHRALVAEFALDYPTAATWYREAQQRAQTIALAPDHPLARLIADGIERSGQGG
ncbi:hypothetical protein Haur_5225 (plasmid) [Herpetosiphon aurantiacus DSM 785]|uniref:Tetratricopeptide repeat protein n=1 Tax=Herpetosiphon aurantiacus (strain ATCC 23779 / DSM 785 / 114-95) TaxID=316274 RepID=A9B938_HERA2|nr:hypothetical protein Haur_5225 [Herpetosiphon aurantiacus DSM 785]